MGSTVVAGIQQERDIHIAAGDGAVACHGTKEVPGDDLGALGQDTLQNAGDSLARERLAGSSRCVVYVGPGRVHSRQYKWGDAQVKPVHGRDSAAPIRADSRDSRDSRLLSAPLPRAGEGLGASAHTG